MAEHTNRLIDETSPYLRQHAHNPVDWYPWGDEALARARDEDKPILLSIGYSACHWCHVMAHESFENEALAQAMNERFVSIKVDREERPDLDQIYQTVCQLLTRSGGWPLTVFLTPQGEPYFAGTYFPPEERYGRPGFKEVLQAMADAYHTARDQVAEQAKRILEVLGQVQGGQAGTLDADILDHAYESLRGSFDQVNGGFGDAPKFPNPFNLELFLRHYARTMEPDALANAVHACRCMRAGGIYDQLGGGFHRYSVDGEWRVPHFEKMLYDNALLANVYLSAWQASAQDDLAATVRETLDYLLAEMRHPSGGFYSATDADSEGEEGKFFVWTQDEVEAALEPTLAALVCERFGITRRGNFEGGATVLNVVRTVEELAAGRGQTPTQVRSALEDARRTLLEVRARREPPFRDEKLLAAWNGLALSALARAGLALAEPRYLAAATELARFLTDTMTLGGHLYRVCKDGVVKVPGYLDDYGAVAGGLLDLFAATGEAEWFRQAAALCETVLAEFSDGEVGDFYMTAVGAEPLVVRPKDIHDGAVPSGLSLTAHNLLRLWHLTGDERYRTRVEQALRAHAETMRNNAWGSAWLVCALDSLLAAPQSLVIVGDGQEAESLLAAASANYRPHLLVCRRAADTPEHDLPPLLRDRGLVSGRAAAYACHGFACQAPVTDAEALLAALDDPT